MAQFSIIIPFYQSIKTISYTLESVHLATQNLDCEVILVDDGSTPVAEIQLKDTVHPPGRIIRQKNQGLLFARLRGLEEARGEYTLFLDADDLIGPKKLQLALKPFENPKTMIVYTDTAKARLAGNFEQLVIEKGPQSPETTNLAEFCISVQPAPHGPIFRTNFLKELVERPLFPAKTAYNPVAEIWFYFNAALKEGCVQRVAGFETICGIHDGARITNCWEKLSAASLLVEEAFFQACPKTTGTEDILRLFGEKIFRRWRALPFDYSAHFQKRKIHLWKSSPKSRINQLGYQNFQRLAKLIGPLKAGWLLRRIKNRSYEKIRTLPKGVSVDDLLKAS